MEFIEVKILNEIETRQESSRLIKKNQDEIAHRLFH
jgi:hypothetical protein